MGRVLPGFARLLGLAYLVACVVHCAADDDDGVPGFVPWKRTEEPRSQVDIMDASTSAESLALALHEYAANAGGETCPLLNIHVALVDNLRATLSMQSARMCAAFYRAHKLSFARLRTCAAKSQDPVLQARTTALLTKLGAICVK